MKPISLSPSQVLEIRNEYATTNVTSTQLAQRFRVGRSSILAIVHGEIYRQVGGPLMPRKLRRPTEEAYPSPVAPPVFEAPPSSVPPMPAPATPENAQIVAMAVVKLRSGSPPMVVAHVDQSRGYAQVSWFDAGRGLQVSTAPISALEVVRS